MGQNEAISNRHLWNTDPPPSATAQTSQDWRNTQTRAVSLFTQLYQIKSTTAFYIIKRYTLEKFMFQNQETEYDQNIAYKYLSGKKKNEGQEFIYMKILLLGVSTV